MSYVRKVLVSDRVLARNKIQLNGLPWRNVNELLRGVWAALGKLTKDVQVPRPGSQRGKGRKSWCHCPGRAAPNPCQDRVASRSRTSALLPLPLSPPHPRVAGPAGVPPLAQSGAQKGRPDLEGRSEAQSLISVCSCCIEK